MKKKNEHKESSMNFDSTKLELETSKCEKANILEINQFATSFLYTSQNNNYTNKRLTKMLNEKSIIKVYKIITL